MTAAIKPTALLPANLLEVFNTAKSLDDFKQQLMTMVARGELLIKAPPAAPNPTEIKTQRLLELRAKYEAIYGDAEISLADAEKEFNCSPSTIRNWLRLPLSDGEPSVRVCKEAPSAGGRGIKKTVRKSDVAAMVELKHAIVNPGQKAGPWPGLRKSKRGLKRAS